MSLRITNLSKRYADKWVLRDISFEVEPGEILGIFGASGSGKSVLIRGIAGTEKTNGGTVHYRDADVTTLTCDDRKFHSPVITGDSFWKTLFKTNKQPEIADGEGQIMAMNDALEKADGVLLLDNSFCNVDAYLRYDAYKRLRKVVKEKNLSVMFATNDYDEICLTCDRVAILSGTQCRQVGTPQEVYQRPATARVAEIVGRNNLFTARRLTSNKVELPEFLTLDGNHRLFAQKTESKHALGAINQNVTLAIRPEHISMSFGASFPEDNLLKAVVRGVTYLGATTLVELDCSGLRLEAIVLRLVGLNIGDECMVGLPPDRILILKD